MFDDCDVDNDESVSALLIDDGVLDDVDWVLIDEMVLIDDWVLLEVDVALS